MASWLGSDLRYASTSTIDMQLWYWIWDDWFWVSTWWASPTLLLGFTAGWLIAYWRSEGRLRARARGRELGSGAELNAT